MSKGHFRQERGLKSYFLDPLRPLVGVTELHVLVLIDAVRDRERTQGDPGALQKQCTLGESGQLDLHGRAAVAHGMSGGAEHE